MLLNSKGKLDSRVAELGVLVRDIVKRFESANVVAANGPHAELTMQETRVVEMLGESGCQMMRAVADYLGVAVNSVTTIADNLEAKGLLTRKRSSTDRRVVHVELTPAGHQASRSVVAVKSQFHREMLSSLTDEEQAILLLILRKIAGLESGEPQVVQKRQAKSATTKRKESVSSISKKKAPARKGKA